MGFSIDDLGAFTERVKALCESVIREYSLKRFHTSQEIESYRYALDILERIGVSDE